MSGVFSKQWVKELKTAFLGDGNVLLKADIDSSKLDSLKSIESELLHIENFCSNYRKLYNMLQNPAFILTGSRRFGHSRPSSDCDYFIKMSDWNALLKEFSIDENTLFDNGFRVRGATAFYNDPSIAMLVEFGRYVDIQVIHDEYYDRKVEAQDRFARYMYEIGDQRRYLSKSDISQIWKVLILSQDHEEKTNEPQPGISEA